MKRSEMINILLDEMTKLHGEQIGHDFEVKLANLLLDRIEKAGMLPPEVKDYINSTVIELNEWEPE